MAKRSGLVFVDNHLTMIAYLRGKVLEKKHDSIVVIVQDIGYRIYLAAPSLDRVRAGEEREFHTHEHVREDARDLFGFLSAGELDLFLSLIKVSGIGPKTALNVMALGEEKIREAITKGDVALLCSVSGVGKKTAQQIILDLQGKLVGAPLASARDTEMIEVLRGLGYSQREASDALAKIPESEKTEDRLRAALKLLGRQR